MKALGLLRHALVIGAMAAASLVYRTAPASAAANDPCIGERVARCLLQSDNTDMTAWSIVMYAEDMPRDEDFNVNAVELRIAFPSGRVDKYPHPPSHDTKDTIRSAWYGCHGSGPYTIRVVGDFAWRIPTENPTATRETRQIYVTVCDQP
jgi:hypothetical protein